MTLVKQKYAIFSGMYDENLVGMRAFKQTFASIILAEDYIDSITDDWWQLVDLESMQIIKYNEYS